ncbi:MAG TPA: phage tail sheath C-terminal domain-containing protein [Gemmatimonadaceae bacterium]
MSTYATPGVYYETVDASSTLIAAVRTDVAGFVGIADRGPLDVPVPVESWRQFQAHFGDVIGSGYLAYTVRAFFENGGSRCWVVRVASRDPLAGAWSASTVLRQSAASPDVWRVRASSPGSWGNGLMIQVRETHRAQTSGDLAASIPTATSVANTSGFARGTLVRLTQPPPRPPMYKVVNEVDAANRRLVWTTDRPEQRLPYDGPVIGLDASQPVVVESVEYTIAVTERGVVTAVHEALSVIPEHPNYGPRMLAPETPPLDVLAQGGVPAAPYQIAIDELRPSYIVDPSLPRPSSLDVVGDDLPPSTTATLSGGRDGLRLLTATDFTGEEWAPEDSDEIKAQRRRGFRALAQIDEVAMLAVPDILIHPIAPPQYAPLPPCIPDPCLPTAAQPKPPVPPRSPLELPPVFDERDVNRVQADLIQHCESLNDRFALLDPPYDASHDPALGVAGIQAWRQRFDSRMAALYHPWIRVVDPLRGAVSPTRDVPPCGHIAGQIAKTDLTIGVHKAPANAVLEWAQDVTFPLGDTPHGILNDLGVNVIRALPGRGLRILGARTVSSDPSWRYVPVRRLMLMIMKAIDRSTQWAVFEPNDVNTREQLRLSLTVYLSTLWQLGQLAGDSIQAAFFVICDDTNNTDDDRANGRVIADVGIAPTIPFEFVVVRVWRAGNALELSEGPTTRSGGTR